MSHPVLFASDDRHVVVLDLPTSISWAQHTHYQLRSVIPAANPFETPEPKGKKLARLQDAVPSNVRRYQIQVEAAVELALEEAKLRLASHSWCFPRTISEDTSLATERPQINNQINGTLWPPLILSPGLNRIQHDDIADGVVVHNPHDVTVDIVTIDLARFHIPPGSAFLMSTIGRGLGAFSQATRILIPGSRVTFDLIVMDPPWSNRSVRNSKAYCSTEDQENDPFGQIIPIIQHYRAAQGYVAVWITNKPSIREQVNAAFVPLGLHLVEEWIWIKITSSGEPVMPLGGVWRKPYEILLLFGDNRAAPSITRKVVAAVADVHSRKPNLRVLFDELFPSPYRGLELFARSLTAGWWSWGNEVLKFQHESCWLPPPDWT